MKKLVFRIRKEYFDAIVEGTKRIEYRKDSQFWGARIRGFDRIENSQEYMAVFICGKRTHRREIVAIERIKTPDYFSEQGNLDVDTPTCLAFHLGKILLIP